MKKELIFGYYTNNLGDDLLIYSYLQNTKNSNLNQHLLDFDKRFSDYFLNSFANCNVIWKGFKTKVVMRSRILIKLRAKKLSKIYDSLVIIGGSMFIESNNESNSTYFMRSLIDEFNKSKKLVNIKGANFGPFNNDNYVTESKKTFQKCTSVFLRDEESFKLFSEMPNVYLNTDLAFSLDSSEFSINLDISDNFVIINPINLELRKGLEKYGTQYLNYIVKNIDEFNSRGLKTVIMSFCNFEGDMDFINEIYSHTDQNVNSVYSYTGDLVEALVLFSKCKFVVGSRFHALILSIIFNKEINIISYSDKIDNFISRVDSSQLDSIVKFEELSEKTYINNSEKFVKFTSETPIKLRDVSLVMFN